jgi:16S rRNA (uracil1498-N3)-methyltransferase
MKLHRFFIHDEPVGGAYVVQDEALVHQMNRVLHLQVGEQIALVPGAGDQYICEITEMTKSYVAVQALEARAAWMPTRPITLYLAVIRKERFEWALEKCTEIGVASIIPVITARTERGVVSRERAEKIMTEAAEQCGRGAIPTFGEPISIRSALMNAHNPIVCDQGGESLLQLQKTIASYPEIHVFIGPEGGWDDVERELVRDAHARAVSLGETTLRAETAAVVACAFMQALVY